MVSSDEIAFIFVFVRTVNGKTTNAYVRVSARFCFLLEWLFLLFFWGVSANIFWKSDHVLHMYSQNWKLLIICSRKTRLAFQKNNCFTTVFGDLYKNEKVVCRLLRATKVRELHFWVNMAVYIVHLQIAFGKRLLSNVIYIARCYNVQFIFILLEQAKKKF